MANAAVLVYSCVFCGLVSTCVYIYSYFWSREAD